MMAMLSWESDSASLNHVKSYCTLQVTSHTLYLQSKVLLNRSKDTKLVILFILLPKYIFSFNIESFKDDRNLIGFQIISVKLQKYLKGSHNYQHRGP